MTSQALTLPLDITWWRLAFSRDLVDPHIGDLGATADVAVVNDSQHMRIAV